MYEEVGEGLIKLSQGKWGVSQMVLRKSDQKHFCCYKLPMTENSVNEVKRQRKILRNFKHKNIVGYIESFLEID